MDNYNVFGIDYSVKNKLAVCILWEKDERKSKLTYFFTSINFTSMPLIWIQLKTVWECNGHIAKELEYYSTAKNIVSEKMHNI